MQIDNHKPASCQRWRPYASASTAAAFTLCLATASILPAADHPTVAPRQYLAELARLGSRKPFLMDSPDVYLEPQSLGQFFKDAIYRKLQGNSYFGYDYDEGFVLEGRVVQIEVLNDLTAGKACQKAYRLALEQALNAAGFQLKPAAPIQIGVGIVGVEPRESDKTLAGIMVEAYARNRRLKKSFFIRYGAGHPRGLPAAVRLSAEMLVSQILSKATTGQESGRVTPGSKVHAGRGK